MLTFETYKTIYSLKYTLTNTASNYSLFNIEFTKIYTSSLILSIKKYIF